VCQSQQAWDSGPPSLLILRATDLFDSGRNQSAATQLALVLYVLHNIAATVISIPAGRHDESSTLSGSSPPGRSAPPPGTGCSLLAPPALVPRPGASGRGARSAQQHSTSQHEPSQVQAPQHGHITITSFPVVKGLAGTRSQAVGRGSRDPA
jgi:hypothetical protein